MKTTFALCLIASGCLPAMAEGIFQRPESCVLIATAQYDDCSVISEFRCDNAPSMVFRSERLESDGTLQVTAKNANHVTTHFAESKFGISLDFEAVGAHPSEAIANGRASSSSKVLLQGQELGSLDSELTHSGKSMEIAGISFLELEKTESMMGVNTLTKILFQPETDLMVTGALSTPDGADPSLSFSLKSLALPGQDGFGLAQPALGCGSNSWLEPSEGGARG